MSKENRSFSKLTAVRERMRKLRTIRLNADFTIKGIKGSKSPIHFEKKG